MFLTASRNPFATPLIAGAAVTNVYTGEGAKYNVFGCYLLHPRNKIRRLHSDVHLDIKLGYHLSLLFMFLKSTVLCSTVPLLAARTFISHRVYSLTTNNYAQNFSS